MASEAFISNERIVVAQAGRDRPHARLVPGSVISQIATIISVTEEYY